MWRPKPVNRDRSILMLRALRRPSALRVSGRALSAASASASANAWAPVEAKWQRRWALEAQARAPTAPADGAKEPYYCLAMFPYPSGRCLRVAGALLEPLEL